MAIPFKRVGRKDPRKIDGVLKYHPQLVTMGQSVDLDSIAYIMKDKSSPLSGRYPKRTDQLCGSNAGGALRRKIS